MAFLLHSTADVSAQHVIHRAVERQVSARPEVPALIDGLTTLSYREMNARANVVARHLMTSGCRRGQRVIVHMPRSADLAIVLLAVLKCGAAYSWIDAEAAASDLPLGTTLVEPGHDGEERYHFLDLSGILDRPMMQAAPNLPVLAREIDLACVVPARDGRPALLIPHATIAGISVSSSSRADWTDPAAFDLWVALCAGATVTLESNARAIAAA